MVCLYHKRDLDGFASGAIVKLWHEINGSDELKMIGFDYGNSVPYDKIGRGEKVVMIDVSLKMPDMLSLAEHIGDAENFIWIDHHISAINEYKQFITKKRIPLTPVLEDGIAACEVGWKYFFPNKLMPKPILLLGMYDTWRNEDKVMWENEVLPFQYGMRLRCNSPESFPVSLLIVVDYQSTLKQCEKIISHGEIVLKYQGMIDEMRCKNAFEIEFGGLRAICLNADGANSNTFKSVYDERKHDIMMAFQYDGKKWIISMYTTKDSVDCASIAKLNGGGGHQKAAGFHVKDIAQIIRF